MGKDMHVRGKKKWNGVGYNISAIGERTIELSDVIGHVLAMVRSWSEMKWAEDINLAVNRQEH